MLRSLWGCRSYRALVPLFFVAKVAILALVVAAVIIYLTRDSRTAR